MLVLPPRKRGGASCRIAHLEAKRDGPCMSLLQRPRVTLVILVNNYFPPALPSIFEHVHLILVSLAMSMAESFVPITPHTWSLARTGDNTMLLKPKSLFEMMMEHGKPQHKIVI